ncbi:MAG TPA: TonB family protein [Bacteroidia bacterium]|nr:TonB family protein [Bacteroidia bacterium]
MNTYFNSNQNFNELVFENKNKAYGAYAIRKAYKDNVTISLVVTSAFFGLLALLSFSFTNKSEVVPTVFGNDSIFVKPYKEVEIKIEPKVKPESKVDAAPKSTSGAMTASDDKKNVLDKTNTDLVINKNPNPFGNDSAAPKDPEIKLPPTPTKKKEVVLYVDKMPKLDKMAQFIADNLRYPRVAVENGTSGTVHVTFVVEEDGSITNIKLLQGIGDGCEEEAIRVVSIMPQWEPGMHKGEPQRVQCNLPIKFRIK